MKIKRRKYIRRSPRIIAKAEVQKMLSDEKNVLRYLNMLFEKELPKRR
jgi:hypothetical protein